jgi:hypothetical protein
MSWIKRNLYFCIFGVVALGLMGFGGFLLFQQISEENRLGDEIGQQYSKLQELNNQKPHPGSGKIDNIKLANEQRAALTNYIGKARVYFQRIPPIPDTGTARVSNEDFATQLRPTIVGLIRSANSLGVKLPKSDYYFSFESERAAVVFGTNGLDKLAVQLGEVKVISEMILGARVSAFDYIRREPVITNDTVASDFLVTERTASTPLADISPYQVGFHCFSGELGQVMAQFANSADGLIVKSVSIEPAATGGGLAMGDPNFTTMPEPPPSLPPPGEQPFRGAGGGRRGMGGPPPTTPVPPPAYTKGDRTLVNEKPFRVTLMIMVVKPKPSK